MGKRCRDGERHERQADHTCCKMEAPTPTNQTGPPAPVYSPRQCIKNWNVRAGRQSRSSCREGTVRSRDQPCQREREQIP